jgi:hypothetical protein
MSLHRQVMQLLAALQVSNSYDCIGFRGYLIRIQLVISAFFQDLIDPITPCSELKVVLKRSRITAVTTSARADSRLPVLLDYTPANITKLQTDLNALGFFERELP